MFWNKKKSFYEFIEKDSYDSGERNFLLIDELEYRKEYENVILGIDPPQKTHTTRASSNTSEYVNVSSTVSPGVLNLRQEV